jgi:isopenicillin N synthase-like dioxygenase
MKTLNYNVPSEWNNNNIISSFLESGFLVINQPFVHIKESLDLLKENLKKKLNESEITKEGYKKIVIKNCDSVRQSFLKIGCEILYVIEEFLDVPPNSITMKHADSDNALRFIKYYKEQKGLIRIGEHCDFGTLTLVHVCDPVEEYEIFYDDKWRTINHPSDDFLIVNIGDFMQIWSDNKLQSTPHRITNKTKKERHSMIMFMDAGNHIIKGIDHATWNKDRIEKAQSGMTYYHK